MKGIGIHVFELTPWGPYYYETIYPFEIDLDYWELGTRVAYALKNEHTKETS